MTSLPFTSPTASLMVSPPIPGSGRDSQDTEDGPKAPPRRRANVACTVCHARKVRCNVSTSGLPCWNCKQDGANCVLHVSARGKYKRTGLKGRKKSNPHAESSETTNADSLANHSLSSNPAQISNILSYSPISVRELVIGNTPTPVQSGNQPQPSPHSLPPSSTTGPPGEEDTGENVDSYRDLINPQSKTHRPHEPLVPFFIGELQGLRYIFNIKKGDVLSSNSHFRIARPARRQLSPEELAFLNAREAFSLPPDELRDELIRCFFEFVHPLLPVVDAARFLFLYESSGAENISILLLQSIFFAASNFISQDVLDRLGVPSPKALKRQFYQRAKSLYDLDYEKDKIPLIQSVLLMGYWYVDTHDRADSWHWVGIAVSLGQSIGLHRNPRGNNIPESQRQLFRRIWWSCLHRDRWIALGMGRPTRISLDDCDTKMLTPSDLIDPNPHPEGLSDASRAIIETCDSLAPMFVETVKLSVLFGNVLKCHYGASHPTLEEIQIRENDLSSWYDELDPGIKADLSLAAYNESPLMSLHKHWLHIYFQVTVITLHRPVIFRNSFDSAIYPRDMPELARTKSVTAASAATESLRRLVTLDLVKALPPETVTALTAIIAIQFLERFWTTGLSRHIASQKLDLSMMVLRELSGRYWAANFILTFFKAAFEKIETALGFKPNPASNSSGENTESSYPQTNTDLLSTYNNAPYAGNTIPPMTTMEQQQQQSASQSHITGTPLSPQNGDGNFANFMDIFGSPTLLRNEINAILRTSDLVDGLNGYVWDDFAFSQDTGAG